MLKKIFAVSEQNIGSEVQSLKRETRFKEESFVVETEILYTFTMVTFVRNFTHLINLTSAGAKLAF